MFSETPGSLENDAHHTRCRYLRKAHNRAAPAAMASPGTKIIAKGMPPGSPSPRWLEGPFWGSSCNQKERKGISS